MIEYWKVLGKFQSQLKMGKVTGEKLMRRIRYSLKNSLYDSIVEVGVSLFEVFVKMWRKILELKLL